jgi:hypothetical protein
VPSSSLEDDEDGFDSLLTEVDAWILLMPAISFSVLWFSYCYVHKRAVGIPAGATMQESCFLMSASTRAHSTAHALEVDVLVEEQPLTSSPTLESN